MLGNGHPDARKYPLSSVIDEAAIVAERLNTEEVTRATLIKLAISATLSKEGGKLWVRQLDSLDVTTIAREGTDDGGSQG